MDTCAIASCAGLALLLAPNLALVLRERRERDCSRLAARTRQLQASPAPRPSRQTDILPASERPTLVRQ